MFDIAEMDNSLATEMDVKYVQGVAVLDLDPKGSAAISGIQKKDIIIRRVNNKRINSIPELQEAISQSRVGDELTLIVSRDGREKRSSCKNAVTHYRIVRCQKLKLGFSFCFDVSALL